MAAGRKAKALRPQESYCQNGVDELDRVFHGDASKDFPDQGLPNKTVYGPPPRPYPTLHPQRTPPVALYGPPPRPYPTLDPQRPPPFAPLYGPPPRNPLD